VIRVLPPGNGKTRSFSTEYTAGPGLLSLGRVVPHVYNHDLRLLTLDECIGLLNGGFLSTGENQFGRFSFSIDGSRASGSSRAITKPAELVSTLI
jgi:hypothetical protein